MSKPHHHDPSDPAAEALRDDVRSASELLERIVADRGLLAALPPEERKRLVAAAALVYHPDAKARRKMVKATTRRRK
ncbi:MAG TPA: oxidoreductase, partial [Gemmatimonadaceae bacterium]|nr:oxidoreductase [Gemmatimonadaceae bacterium]